MTQERTLEKEGTKEDWPSTAARLADIIAHYPVHNRGGLAELRRMDPEEPDAPTFWRLTNQHRLGMSPENERRWATILQAIALLTPNANREGRVTSAHNRRMPVGTALFQGKDPQRESALCDEQRLEQLAGSRGKAFRKCLLNLVRTLAQQDARLNCEEIARMVLGEGRNRKEQQRRMSRVTRDYYRAEYRMTQVEEEEED